MALLMTCDRLGLIGRNMFASDGVELAANASKERSGAQGHGREQDHALRHFGCWVLAFIQVAQPRIRMYGKSHSSLLAIRLTRLSNPGRSLWACL